MPSATSFIEAFTKTVLLVHCDNTHYWRTPLSKTAKIVPFSQKNYKTIVSSQEH